MSDKLKYEIADSEHGFVTCVKAEPTSNGWLHYELADGTIGLKRPGTWRVKVVLNGKT